MQGELIPTVQGEFSFLIDSTNLVSNYFEVHTPLSLAVDKENVDLVGLLARASKDLSLPVFTAGKIKKYEWSIDATYIASKTLNALEYAKSDEMVEAILKR